MVTAINGRIECVAPVIDQRLGLPEEPVRGGEPVTLA
jgi:hypothetical protein